MGRQTLRRAQLGLLLAPALGAMGGVAVAQEAAGVWERDTGSARVRIAPCGPTLCGTLSWLAESEGPARVGQRIFYDMKPDGAASWSGKALNPEDGKTYSAKMTVSGDTLSTSGCVLGGLICRSVSWKRFK